MTASAATPTNPSLVALSVGEVPGALPSSGAVERDLGDAVEIATPHYALTLPKSSLGEGFSWSYDGQREATEEETDEPSPRILPYVATSFLEVDPANGADEPFTVYAQTGQPEGCEPPPQAFVEGREAVLAANAHGQAYCSWNVFVASPGGTDRWNALVSPGGRAGVAPEPLSAELTAEAWRVKCPYWSFETPVAWRGLVGATLEGSSLTVWPLSAPEAPVLSVEVAPAFGERPAPSSEKGELLAEHLDGAGRVVRMWACPRSEANIAFDPALAAGALEPARTERWATVHGLACQGAEDSRTLADLHALVRQACGAPAECAWLAELAADPEVLRWEAAGYPEARSLVRALAPLSQAESPADLAWSASWSHSGGFGLGTLELEAAFWPSDPVLAPVSAYKASRFALARVGRLTPEALGFAGNPPATAEDASARVAEAVGRILRAHARPGAAYAAAWRYAAPDGSEASGYVEA